MNTRSFVLVGMLMLAGALVACAPAATPAPSGSVEAMATAAPAATSAPADSAVAGQPGLLPPASQMIIKNANIEVLVPDSGQALSQVTQLAAAHGGYVLNSETSYIGDLQHATVQFAVPAAQFEATLSELRGLGTKVLKESTSGQDVSAEYTDLQSRLDNLEATAARVRSFLDASKTVSDSLAVNSQLSDLEAQIEQIKGQMKYDEGRSAFSTVTVTLTPEAPVALPQADPAWNPLRTLSRALATLGQMLRASTDIVIWLVVLSSPLIALLIAVLFVRSRFVRRTAPRSR